MLAKLFVNNYANGNRAAVRWGGLQVRIKNFRIRHDRKIRRKVFFPVRMEERGEWSSACCVEVHRRTRKVFLFPRFNAATPRHFGAFYDSHSKCRRFFGRSETIGRCRIPRLLYTREPVPSPAGRTPFCAVLPARWENNIYTPCRYAHISGALFEPIVHELEQ